MSSDLNDLSMGLHESPKRRILIVDDEDTVLFAMKRYLDRLGYRVDCAREREEAEALLTTQHYDLLIADLRLTGAEGTEGLELVSHAQRVSPGIHAIILTAFGSAAVERLARERGIAEFLQKPQPLATIAQVAKRLLGDDPLPS
jgi:DNA-binding NtrC family response regulator